MITDMNTPVGIPNMTVAEAVIWLRQELGITVSRKTLDCRIADGTLKLREDVRGIKIIAPESLAELIKRRDFDRRRKRKRGTQPAYPP
jgi:hypothetical protein